MSVSHSVSQNFVLECQAVDVQRGDFVLCADVNFSLKQGDICHLIGENGTGKTTFLMQLAGLLPIINGEVAWQGQAGLPIQPIYIAHQVGIHLQLTVAQNLRFLLALYGMSPNAESLAEALAWVGLSGYEDIACYQLSAGQTRRVGLARLWFSKAVPLWLLDEPLTALDVNMVKKIEIMLADYASQGGTVLMTSHQPVAVANMTLDLTDFML